MKINFIKTGLLSLAVLFASCNNSNNQNANTANDTTNIDGKSQEQVIENKTGNAETSIQTENSGKIAYINVDSLLINYKYYQELEQKMTAKYQKAEREFNAKQAQFEKEVADFKKKEATNSFLSQESYQMQGQALMQKQQELQNLNLKLSQELEQHRANLTQRIQDTVFNYIKEWNKTAGYDFILNNLSLIYAKPGSNITAEILDLLNKRYDETHNKAKK